MVYEYLLTGEATTSHTLCKLTGLTQRELTMQIMNERRAGFPICASGEGYYLADSRNQMEAYCKSLYRRLGEVAKTYRACKAIADKLPEGEP